MVLTVTVAVKTAKFVQNAIHAVYTVNAVYMKTQTANVIIPQPVQYVKDATSIVSAVNR